MPELQAAFTEPDAYRGQRRRLCVLPECQLVEEMATCCPRRVPYQNQRLIMNELKTMLQTRSDTGSS